MQATPNWVEQRALLTPTRPALVTGDGKEYTWAQVHDAVSEFTRGLLALGVRPGDRAAILSGNGLPFALSVYALAQIGATAVPINTRLTDAEIKNQLQIVDTRTLLADAPHMDRARSLAERVISLDELTVVSVRSGRQRSSLPPVGEQRLSLDDPQGILFTSGTTGSPKGAVLTFGNHWWSAIGSALNLGLRESDRWLLCLPLFHIGGLSILIRSVIYGISAVVHERFDPERANWAIDREGVTIVSVVSQMLERMLDARRDAPFPNTLRCVLTGGGPVPAPLLERCARARVPVVQTYGLTETASQAATLSPEDALERLGSAGKPLFCTEIKVDAPRGEVGEIHVRGPNVSPGYITANGFERRNQEWLRTGDLGWLDQDGYLFVAARRTDLIISGGENIYPAEVESVLESHPDVLEAGVVAKDDSRWGQVPVAFVVARPGRLIDREALASHCGKSLAKFKVPVDYFIVDSLPRNASRKLLRHKLRELVMQGRELKP